QNPPPPEVLPGRSICTEAKSKRVTSDERGDPPDVGARGGWFVIHVSARPQGAAFGFPRSLYTPYTASEGSSRPRPRQKRPAKTPAKKKPVHNPQGPKVPNCLPSKNATVEIAEGTRTCTTIHRPVEIR